MLENRCRGQCDDRAHLLAETSVSLDLPDRGEQSEDRSSQGRTIAHSAQACRSVPVALWQCLTRARASCCVCATAAVGGSVPVALAPLRLQFRVRHAMHRQECRQQVTCCLECLCLAVRAGSSVCGDGAVP